MDNSEKEHYWRNAALTLVAVVLGLLGQLLYTQGNLSRGLGDVEKRLDRMEDSSEKNFEKINQHFEKIESLLGSKFQDHEARLGKLDKKP